MRQSKAASNASASKVQAMGAFAVIFDAEANVLLCHRTDRDAWNLPGGKVEAGEAPWEAAVREVHEEIGLHVRVRVNPSQPGFTCPVSQAPIQPRPAPVRRPCGTRWPLAGRPGSRPGPARTSGPGETALWHDRSRPPCDTT